MILTLFLQGVDPQLGGFFITHFSICHSFLDSYIKADLARNWVHGNLARKWGGCPGWHSRTVAQCLSLRLNRRSHVTSRDHMSQNHENPPAFDFPLYR